MSVHVTFHEGSFKRWTVPVRCTSHKNIWTPEDGVSVFAGTAAQAKLAACEKMTDKYLRHQNKRTRWVTTGEPVES